MFITLLCKVIKFYYFFNKIKKYLLKPIPHCLQHSYVKEYSIL